MGWEGRTPLIGGRADAIVTGGCDGEVAEVVERALCLRIA